MVKENSSRAAGHTYNLPPAAPPPPHTHTNTHTHTRTLSEKTQSPTAHGTCQCRSRIRYKHEHGTSGRLPLLQRAIHQVLTGIDLLGDTCQKMTSKPCHGLNGDARAHTQQEHTHTHNTPPHTNTCKIQVGGLRNLGTIRGLGCGLGTCADQPPTSVKLAGHAEEQGSQGLQSGQAAMFALDSSHAYRQTAFIVHSALSNPSSFVRAIGEPPSPGYSCACVCVCVCVCVCTRGGCHIKEEDVHGSMGHLL